MALTATGSFSGMSVKDVPEAVRFWRDVVGLAVDDGPIATLHLPGGGTTIVYPKPDHTPAGFTVLNFEVDDVAAAIRELGAAGLEPERYPGMPQDDDGAMRGNGPDIAWFTDPSGNIFSVLKA
ncbi:VOC family protein [uncultured Amnibacterium sp.]|uniref:VOC family protein n=1 Tax=uncultured Amnibacterium sp. TaxID=1631851 RepID=UPI0035CB3B9E